MVHMSICKLTRLIAAVSVLGPAGVSGSAQTLTLDNFKSGAYTVTLEAPQAQNEHFAPLSAGSRLGPARETVLTIGANPYGQKTTLDIHKGICILDGGFGVIPGVQIYYGFADATTPAPLGLNLTGYSAFRLNFAGISTELSLGVEIAVFAHSGAIYGAQQILSPTPSNLSVDFPFSSFVPSAVDVSDIDTIGIVTWGGGTNSYGITSFQAVE